MAPAEMNDKRNKQSLQERIEQTNVRELRILPGRLYHRYLYTSALPCYTWHRNKGQHPERRSQC